MCALLLLCVLSFVSLVHLVSSAAVWAALRLALYLCSLECCNRRVHTGELLNLCKCCWERTSARLIAPILCMLACK